MAAKLIRLTHKIATKLRLLAESCTICSSRSSQLVRKLLDTLVFGPESEEVAGGGRRLRNETLHNLCASQNIIRLIKSRDINDWGM